MNFGLKHLSILMLVGLCLFAGTPAYASALNYTVNTSENVTVTGTPRLALTIGSTTRYATYSAGTGTNALTFSYTPVAGDFDADGIAVASPVDLNGGTIADAAGNNLALTYTPTATPLVKAQAYIPTLTTTPVTDANKTAVAFSIAGAPVGSTYNYTFTSSGGGTPVTGSGSVASDPQTVSGINLSDNLYSGTLTLSLTITAASGTGAVKTATAAYTNTFTGVLDSIASASGAYSIRRLKTSYTGSLIKVRRSSDSTTQDIGYTAGGNLDTAALTTFCGSNSCYIDTWYDQSGGAHNATQATTANQMRIVNAGTIDRSGTNNRPAVNCTVGTSASATSVMASNADYTKNAVVMQTATSTYGNFLSGSTSAASNHAFYFGGATAPRLYHSGAFALGPTMALNTQGTTTGTFQKSTNTGTTYTDGVAGTPATSTNGFTDTSIQINGYQGTVIHGITGYIAEALVFKSLLSTTDRQALQTNQKSYYGTP